MNEETNKDIFGEFIYKRTYARWIDSEQRRENWDETVERYRNYFLERFDLPRKMEDRFNGACDMILRKEIVPSMRCLWTAGKALDRENLAGFNCSFITINKIKSFADLLYILMCGTGAGFSVERQVINQLPEVPEEIIESAHPVVFADSRIGWARGLLEYMTLAYDGEMPEYDLSLIRPKGSRLKTFGGRAGGPDDLRILLEHIKAVFMNARGRKLNSIEVHDVCCFISVAVVSAGIRRSACISLSNLSDPRMRDCKMGEFWLANPQRSMANNTVAFTEKPDMHIWMQEWMSLMNSGSGERGIFNRVAAQKQFKKLGRSTVDENGDEYVIGINPCAEVLLRPNEVCNLTEVVIRPLDSLENLLDKVESATVLGCFQSCLTSNSFIGPEWKKNLEEERLLGVSLTGIRDHPVLNRVTQLASIWLAAMRKRAHETAKECAAALEINIPMASTCCKPSGTVSALLNTSSGVHTRFSPFYIRRVRVASTDTMCKFLMHVGVPYHPEIGQDDTTASTFVFEFPIKSPDGAMFDTSAQEQLEYAHMLNKCWADHSTSVTVSIEEDEWMIAGAWVYAHWDDVRGASFLPKSTGVYLLMPFEAITEEEYNKRVEDMPSIDFNDLTKFERDDETTGAQEFACVGGACEVQ